MSLLLFQIQGVTKSDLRRWRNLTRPRKWPIGIVALAFAAIIVYSFGSSTPIRSIAARNVLVMVDSSGSMSGTESIRDRQLAQLREANNLVGDPLNIPGWAISDQKPGYSLLQPLENALSTLSGINTAFIVSDFNMNDDVDNDQAGYQRLQQLIRKYHIRIYLSTVNKPPPPTYEEIANSSGGGVISENVR